MQGLLPYFAADAMLKLEMCQLLLSVAFAFLHAAAHFLFWTGERQCL